MTALRSFLGILGGCSGGYAIAALIPAAGLSITHFGVAVAITAACVIGVYLVKAIEADRRRAADKARHPSAWGPLAPGRPFIEYRAPDSLPIWPRYEIQLGQLDMNPWPIGDDEVRP